MGSIQEINQEIGLDKNFITNIWSNIKNEVYDVPCHSRILTLF